MIKVGDVVGMKVVAVHDDCFSVSGCPYVIDSKFAVEIPMPDPLAGCKEDVIDAAIFLGSQKFGAAVSFQYNGETFSLYGFYTNVFKPRVDALIEAQRPRPPSKYAALRKAINNASGLLQTHGDIFTARTLGDELAKLEAQERNNAL